MADSEDYTFVTTSSHHKVGDDWEAINGAVGFNPNISLLAALRRQYPGLAITVTLSSNGTLSTRAPMDRES